MRKEFGKELEIFLLLKVSTKYDAIQAIFLKNFILSVNWRCLINEVELLRLLRLDTVQNYQEQRDKKG